MSRQVSKVMLLFIQEQYGGAGLSYLQLSDVALSQQYQHQIMQQDNTQAKMQQKILETEAYRAALNAFTGKFTENKISFLLLLTERILNLSA